MSQQLTEEDKASLSNIDSLLSTTSVTNKITQGKRTLVNSRFEDSDDESISEEDKLAFEERRQKYQEWVLRPFLIGMFGAIGMSIGYANFRYNYKRV
ncbi:SLX4 [Acrasis kona]|uniref:SLX4 n=1 Tax=Acrasis kona TaxID=1008807 RepID=A0AAW2Z021_9EUKA